MEDGFLGCPCARDWFLRCRAAALDLSRMQRVVERMRAAEGVRGAPIGGGGRKGGTTNANAATDARMDFEAASADAMSECEDTLRLADEIIWGSEGHGGLAALMGGTVASVVRLRYVDALGWGQLSANLGLSPSRARSMSDSAMDLMDNLGPGRVKDGDGLAT